MASMAISFSCMVPYRRSWSPSELVFSVCQLLNNAVVVHFPMLVLALTEFLKKVLAAILQWLYQKFGFTDHFVIYNIWRTVLAMHYLLWPIWHKHATQHLQRYQKTCKMYMILLMRHNSPTKLSYIQLTIWHLHQDHHTKTPDTLKLSTPCNRSQQMQ